MGVVSCGTTMLDQGVFNNIGAVTWDTTAKTAGFTAVSGNGYFVNTTSGAITVTLPSSPSAGDIVGIKDYANTADTNNITIGRNGSNIQGQAEDFIVSTEGRSVVLVYVDGTQGWKVTSGSQASDIGPDIKYVTATGGTVTCCGDYKIHTFTGPGTFTVTCGGNAAGSNSVDYLVVAGGGGAGGAGSGTGGGGAGGFRFYANPTCNPQSGPGAPINGPAAIPVSTTTYPITVGGGGSGGPASPTGSNGGQGNNSVFSTITSAGGGFGTGFTPTPGNPGGSGGGGPGQSSNPGGTGNTPPTSPPQGSNGGQGNGIGGDGGGGGGGALANGVNGSSGPTPAGCGGAGAGVTGFGTSGEVCGSVYYFSGGGGGGGRSGQMSGAPGGLGGGANGVTTGGGCAGTANTGGGGGGGGVPGPGPGGAGGSGIVIIRYKYQ